MSPSTPSRAGIPVLALHCSLGSGAQWRKLAARLGHRRVLRVDLAGYGAAPMPPAAQPFRLDDEVDLIEAMLTANGFGREPLHVVGHSYGAAVAIKLATRRAARVASLTLFEPVAFWLLGDSPPAREVKSVAEAMRRDVANGSAQDAARRFIDFWNGPDAYAGLPPAARLAFALGVPKTLRDFEACFAETLRLEELRRLSMPVCLAGGTRSPWLTISILHLLGVVLHTAETHTVEGGHMAPIEKADAVNDLIVSFIERHDAAESAAGLAAAA